MQKKIETRRKRDPWVCRCNVVLGCRCNMVFGSRCNVIYWCPCKVVLEYRCNMILGCQCNVVVGCRYNMVLGCQCNMVIGCRCNVVYNVSVQRGPWMFLCKRTDRLYWLTPSNHVATSVHLSRKKPCHLPLFPFSPSNQTWRSFPLKIAEEKKERK